jgi:hypothetical protein
MPLARLERTRGAYACAVCGQSTLSGQHALVTIDVPEPFCLVVPPPRVLLARTIRSLLHEPVHPTP